MIMLELKYIYDFKVDLLKPHSTIAHLKEYQRRLIHKLYAIRYHYGNFRKEADEWIYNHFSFV